MITSFLINHTRGKMQLNSMLLMVVLLPIVIIFWILPQKFKKIYLIVISLLFNMTFGVKRTVCCLVISFLILIFGNRILRTTDMRRKKLILTIAVIIAVMPLLFMKYFADVDFLFLKKNEVKLWLPIGLSYFTFSVVSYLMDTYRGTLNNQSIVNYLLYCLWFPKAISGPIEIANEFNEKIEQVIGKKICKDIIENSVWYIVYGLFLKLYLGDRCGIVADYVFNNFKYLGSFELLFGSLMYTLQIYFDFQGYTCLAIGISGLFGIQLKKNFNTPYFSNSIYNFWKRWHISLTDWLREYIYIPLGGNRKGKIRTDINVFLVFLISGIWHGNGGTFIIWGVIHGLMQILEKHTVTLRRRINNLLELKEETIGHKVFQICTTFFLVNFAWIFFRADTVKVAIEYITRMFTKFDPWNLVNGTIYTLGLPLNELHIFLFGVLIVVIVGGYEYLTHKSILFELKRQSIIFKSVTFFLMVILIFVYGEYGIEQQSTFIYFNF